MHRCVRAPLALLSVTFLSLCLHPASAAVTGYTPPPGYEAEDLGLSGDTLAIARDGRLAVSRRSAGQTAITVYNQVDPVGRTILTTISDPRLQTLGGLSFANGGLLVSENGGQRTVFRASFADGSVTPLAPSGTMPNVTSIGRRPTDGAVFAVASNNPGNGIVYRIHDGTVLPFAANLGSGYLGGLVFDAAGTMFVGDTNDPSFLGNPGRILSLDGVGGLIGVTSLEAGRGSGVYDIARDAYGDLYATTQSTLTRVSNGVATPFGEFSGAFPFPTDIAVDPTGGIVVNGAFTDAGNLFRVRATAIPEPSSLALLGLGLPLLMAWRRKAGAAR